MTTSTSGAATPAVRPRRPRRSPADAPRRAELFAHLALAGLRSYRNAVMAEEHRVSYWRRLVQTRLDLLARSSTGACDDDALRRELVGLLAEQRSGDRVALTQVRGAEYQPPLPDLVALWSRLADADPEQVRRLRHDLVAAERQLSAYRRALHGRLTAATDELVARYREDPRTCLSALPLTPGPPRRSLT